MDAIIHFGMFKTGSTSIQNTLHKLMRGPLQGEFLYVAPDGLPSGDRTIKLLHRKNHGDLTGELHGVKLEHLAEEQAKLRAAFVGQISKANGKTPFFSSESLPIVDQSELAELHGYFKAGGFKPKAVGYIRPPKSLMESDFQQRVKTGAKRFLPRVLFPHYKNLFEKFDPVFGRENVHYWVFDPKTFAHGCVVRDFASHIGMKIAPEDVWRENDALSREALSLLFAYRKHSVSLGATMSSQKNNVLLGKLQTLSGSKVRLHSTQVAPVLDEFSDELAWMEERMGISMAENLTADDASAIRSEADLLNFTSDALRWLSQQLGDTKVSHKLLSGDPIDVAAGVHALYEQHD